MLHLWQVSDVHLHVAALTGPVQPLHVHIQRPGTHRQEKSYKSCSFWKQPLSGKCVCIKGLTCHWGRRGESGGRETHL